MQEYKGLVRKNFYMEDDQLAYLEAISKKGLSVSEHIRRAIDAYITEIKSLQVSTSQSSNERTN